jgi:hypothetical protein
MYSSWSASPVVGEDGVYVTTGHPLAAITALDRVTDAVLWESPSPLVTDGRGWGLLARDLGIVFCYDVRARAQGVARPPARPPVPATAPDVAHARRHPG